MLGAGCWMLDVKARRTYFASLTIGILEQRSNGHQMILDRIVAHKRKELVHRKEAVPFFVLKEQVHRTQTTRRFQQAISGSSEIALIAEVKKASPSAGLIRKDFAPADIATIYEASGAAAVSVVTEAAFFGGSLASLKQVKEAIRIPVLCKDFVIDPYQIYEARVSGADAVLLIAAILVDNELKGFLALCRELGLAALVEVHTEAERDRAIEAGARIIGINNRDLKTFSVDLSATERLSAAIPEGILCVSESGIETADDIRRLREVGVDAVLVGTALMKAEDIGAKIKELFNAENQDLRHHP